MDSDYVCPWQQAYHGCSIHCRLAELQQRLEQELRGCSLSSLLGDDTDAPPVTEKKDP